jgi:PAS domain S-box-containing protein
MVSGIGNRALDAVLATALDAVIVMDERGIVTGWNDIASQTFGWTADEVVGLRMSDFIIPERHRDAHEEGLTHYLATGEGPVLDKHIEIDAMHRAGHEVPIELSITHTKEFGTPIFLGFLRDITERRLADERQQLLIGELNHRMKNLLSVISAVASQTARSSQTIEQFSHAFLGRIESLGQAHSLFTDSNWQHASLEETVNTVLASVVGEDERVSIKGNDVLLDTMSTSALTMVLHELATNALKYGALSGSDGRLDLGWLADGDKVVLRWREHCSTPVTPPGNKGFGTQMINASVRQLGGTADVDWHPDGLEFRVQFPVNGD